MFRSYEDYLVVGVSDGRVYTTTVDHFLTDRDDPESRARRRVLRSVSRRSTPTPASTSPCEWSPNEQSTMNGGGRCRSWSRGSGLRGTCSCMTST